MKPAASLSASLVVRKEQATPSHLTRRFALDDPPALPEVIRAAAPALGQTPLIDNLSETAAEASLPTASKPAKAEAPRPDPRGAEKRKEPGFILRTKPLEIPAPKPPRATLALVGERLPPKTPSPETGEAPARPQTAVPGPHRRPVGCGKRIAMTVRLDHEQHRELHGFADRGGRTCQDVFLRALETYMAIYR